MGAKIVVETFGVKGVNVDKNPLELDPAELTKAQNVVSDPTSGRATLRKRPGLDAINGVAAAGVLLGGIGVPLLDESSFGTHFVYVGRGPA